MDLYSCSAVEILEKIRGGEVSAREVVESSLARMNALEPDLNAIITRTGERAMQRAESIDRMISSGKDAGALAGVPVVIKDNMCVKGIKTTCASRILGDWKPPYTATAVAELEKEGAIVIAKSNMDEFAMGSSTEHSAYGPCSNPWDLDRVPGGSSGGSAASVAAGYVPVSLGSDTGGSIRQPAAYCGTMGLKPTYGLISRWGLVAFASSLDQIGPFTRSIEDIALILNIISRPDHRDSTCSPRKRPDYMSCLESPSLKGKKVGLVKEFMDYDIDPGIRTAVEKAIDVARSEGAEIVEISLPVMIRYGLPTYYILAPAEASSNLARYDGVRYGMSSEAKDLMDLYLKTRGEGFGAEVKRRILTGTYVLSSGYYDAYYLTAQKVRQMMIKEFSEAFSKVDTIFMPTAPTPAFRKGELLDDPIQMYMADVFTLPINMAGLPGLSMNAGYSDSGLPLGVQIIGPRWGEMELLSTAAVLEKNLGRPLVAEGGVR